MKRIYISVAFLIIAGLVSAVETGYVSAKSDMFISKIENTDRLMRKSKFEEAITLCQKAEEEWNECAKKVDMLLIHDYVDDIGVSFSKMRAYAENGSPDMYFSESTSAKKQLASIKESEYPLIENIL